MENIVEVEENQEIVKALKLFPYFETWNKKTISECSRRSKIKKVPPDGIVFGSEEKELSDAYFIIDGTCKLIEHLLLVSKTLADGRTKYSAFRDKSGKCQNSAGDRPKYSSLLFNTAESDSYFEHLRKRTKPNEAVEVSDTVDDVANEGNQENQETQFKRTSKFLQFYRRVLPCFSSKNKSGLHELDNVESHFLQIAFVHKGCCLGLGENLQNRFLVSVTEVTCLVIPLQFLLQNNPNNLWNRIKQFLNSYLPDENKILSEFLTNRRWDIDKREMLAPKHGKKSATIEDVPKSIRLHDSFTKTSLISGIN